MRGNAGDLGPDLERLTADGSVVDGWQVIAAEMKQVVDLSMGR